MVGRLGLFFWRENVIHCYGWALVFGYLFFPWFAICCFDALSRSSVFLIVWMAVFMLVELLANNLGDKCEI